MGTEPGLEYCNSGECTGIKESRGNAMYEKTSAAKVWNNELGIKQRIAITEHLGMGKSLWTKAFEQFSQLEQEKVLGVDWEFTTGKRFPQLKKEK
jgi:hypothetical protein